MGLKVSPEMERRILELADVPAAVKLLPAARSNSPRIERRDPARVRLVVWIPGLRTKAETNVGGKTKGRLARKAAIKEAMRAALPDVQLPLALPTPVVFTRYSTNRMDDDNLQTSLKVVRDCVAAWLNVDDGDRSAVRWVYKQRPGYRAGVKIAIG